jgi:GDP-D-mannose dehydratase
MLVLGNLDAKRDWGHAEDFVEAMWLMPADASKARSLLGWSPKLGFLDLVNRMVQSDLEFAAREKRARG